MVMLLVRDMTEIWCRSKRGTKLEHPYSMHVPFFPEKRPAEVILHNDFGSAAMMEGIVGAWEHATPRASASSLREMMHLIVSYTPTS